MSIDDAIQDPNLRPHRRIEKKHGVFASRCIVCEAAVLKTPHLVTAHLEGKAHKRRMERFQRYVQDQLSETQRKLSMPETLWINGCLEGRTDELEKEKLSQAPPSKRALAKKQKAAEFRQKKKEQASKRKAKKSAEVDNDTAEKGSSGTDQQGKEPEQKAKKDREEEKTPKVKSPSKKADLDTAKEEKSPSKKAEKSQRRREGTQDGDSEQEGQYGQRRTADAQRKESEEEVEEVHLTYQHHSTRGSLYHYTIGSD